MPVAVCDTSTLIRLTKGKAIHCLEKLFDSVYLPESVLVECRDMELVRILRNAPFDVRSVDSVLPLGLGVGEREAISLAVELGVQTFVTDDKKAFRKAFLTGLLPISMVDILVMAKLKGVIPSVIEVLDQMRSRGEGITPELYQTILAKSHQ
ncbi:MAG: DUF3368 domain-containing protein [Magnetococcus sp. YQC-5]